MFSVLKFGSVVQEEMLFKEKSLLTVARRTDRQRPITKAQLEPSTQACYKTRKEIKYHHF